MSNFSKYILLLLHIAFFIAGGSVFSQSEDSLLQKINNIDVSLDAPPDSTENFYLNTVSFQSFYDLLSPVGQWIQISKDEVDEDMQDGKGQGYSSISDEDNLVFVWKPAITEAQWRPYTNGKWVYTVRGWTWVSNENWGWAVYHYGRWWHSQKLGWLWMPGYVWAPAWVQWRVTDNHIGWCALSPLAKWRIETGINEFNYKYRYSDADWAFVEKTNFTDDMVKDRIVSSSQNVNLVAGSKTILNIRNENDAVVNSGPDPGEIEKITGKPVGQKTIKFVNDRSNEQVGENDVSIYNESLKRYKSREDKLNASENEHPVKYRKTEKAKRIIKARIRHRIRLHKKF